ncbi:MAG: hypothetical protein H6Q33_85 [Deltaproteobacteria bacterium]|jgi:hypothetical protein|nr:hypothetical protein [Deltaproteobacteria bacterium]
MARIRIMMTVRHLRRYCRDWVLLRKIVEELLQGAKYAGGPSARRYLEEIYEEVCRREQDAPEQPQEP